jgi:hypothetical protein
MTARVPGLRCIVCGAEEIIAIKPGSDPVYGPLDPATVRGENVAGALLRPGREDVAYCWAHWPCRPPQADLFGKP